MITNICVLICVGVFVYIQFINKEDKVSCAMRLGAFYPPRIRDDHEYWRFITCNFIHIDFIHLLCNIYGLYYLGHFFENMLGSLGYLLLIVMSMLLSSLLCYSASEISSRYEYTITFGASGIVFGFFGAMLALGFLLGGGYMALLRDYMYVIVVNLVYTLLNPRISKTGHIGGLIGGIVAIVILLVVLRA